MRAASSVAAAVCTAAALRAPLFDTQGRLQRTANPPAPLPDDQHRYVVVHKGDVLVETTNDVVDARFLDQQEAAPLVDDGSIVAWLGTLQSKGYWMLDVSHKAQPPIVKGAAFAPLRSPKGDKPAVLNRPADQLPYEDACAFGHGVGPRPLAPVAHVLCGVWGTNSISKTWKAEESAKRATRSPDLELIPRPLY